MNKSTMIESLTKNHNSFIDYINSLTTEEYLYRYQQKWNAKQQLEHIVLCVTPLVQVYSMEPQVIEQHFGKTDRESRSYDVLLSEYLSKLTGGGKAPDRFVPETTTSETKDFLLGKLTTMISVLRTKVEAFSDQELDTLLIPHPLLGNLTLREMLYNAIYHVGHHHNQTIKNLKNK